MALEIKRTSPFKTRIMSTAVIVFALTIQPFVALNIPSAFAASLIPSQTAITLDNATGFDKSVTVATKGHQNVSVTFNFDSRLLDGSQDEYFAYGYVNSDSSRTEMGRVNGLSGNSSAEMGKKTYTLPSTLDDRANVGLYFKAISTQGQNGDSVEVTNVAVNGDVIPVVQPILNVENFNTVDGNYKGISVGFNAKNFGNVTEIETDMTRADGSHVIKTSGPAVLDLINGASWDSGDGKLTIPFVIQEGAFTEAGDTNADGDLYWQPAPAAWTDATAPTSVTITITDESGDKSVTNNTFSHGAPSWPTYESLLMVPTLVDTESPSIPAIATPVNEQYFKAKPIRNEWSASTDNVGVVKYQVAYRYDDGHTVGESTCAGMTIDGQEVSGCRDTTSTSRDHGPSESEQGGVKIWVRAFDEAGNASGWSTPVHYYYDSTNPVFSVSNLSEDDTVRTNNTGGKLTVKGEYLDNVQANYVTFHLIKDGMLKNTQMLYGAKTMGSTLAEFDVATLGLADGVYELQINAADMAGNTASQTINFNLDNTAPVVALTGPANGTISNQAVAIHGTVTDDNPRHYWLEIKQDDTVIYSQTVLMSVSFTDQLLETVTADGDYEVTLAARDLAGGTDSSGNRSEDVVINFTIDSIAPDMPVHESPADNSFQNFDDFYFEWSDVAGAIEYEFQTSQNPSVDGSGALNSGVWNNKVHGGGDRNYLTDSSIHSYGANGTWHWQVRAIDAAGNKSAWTTPWTMTIDKDAPDAPANLMWTTSDGTIKADGDVTNDINGVASWDAGSSSDIEHYVYKYWNDIDGNQYKPGSEYVVELGNTSLPGAFNQGQGTHHFCVEAVDHAGNTSSCTQFTITFDNTPPVLTVNSLISGTGTSRTISGTSEPNANIEVTVHSTPQTKNTVADASGNWSLLFEGLEVGSHTVRVVSTDVAGNILEQLGAFTVFATIVNTVTPPDQVLVPRVVANIPTQPFSQGFIGNNPSEGVTEDDGADTSGESETSSNATTDEQGEEVSSPLTDTEVLGSTDNGFIGLGWYGWLALLAAIVGGWLIIAAAIRRRREQE